MAKELAKRLQIKYLDTGAMYRAVTLKAIRTGVASNDARELARLVENMQIDLHFDENGMQVELDGQDVTEEIRSSQVNENVSPVSTVPAVREAMVAKQQELAAQWGKVVMDGRDIGTCVLPDADLKIYLDATAAERARRRWQENIDKGKPVDYEKVLAEVMNRDQIDSSREVSPLSIASGAVVIDSTEMSLPEVVEAIISRLN